MLGASDRPTRPGVEPRRPARGRAAGSRTGGLEARDFLLCRAYEEGGFFSPRPPSKVFVLKSLILLNTALGVQGPREPRRPPPPQAALVPAAARSLSAGATWRRGAAAGLLPAPFAPAAGGMRRRRRELAADGTGARAAVAAGRGLRAGRGAGLFASALSLRRWLNRAPLQALASPVAGSESRGREQPSDSSFVLMDVVKGKNSSRHLLFIIGLYRVDGLGERFAGVRLGTGLSHASSLELQVAVSKNGFSCK